MYQVFLAGNSIPITKSILMKFNYYFIGPSIPFYFHYSFYRLLLYFLNNFCVFCLFFYVEVILSFYFLFVNTFLNIFLNIFIIYMYLFVYYVLFFRLFYQILTIHQNDATLHIRKHNSPK